MGQMKQDYKGACFEKYGDECFFCESKDTSLLVHFIDGQRTNTELSNLRPACPRCHTSIHDSSTELLEWSLKLVNPPVTQLNSEELREAFTDTPYPGATLEELSEILRMDESIIEQALEDAPDAYSQDVEDANVVWYVSDDAIQPAPSDGISKTHASDDVVILFPDRRELAVSGAPSETMEVLGRVAHLVDMSNDGALYKFDPEDVWNAPHDSFEKYLNDLESIVGNVTPRLVERLQSDWEKATQFTLTTDSKNEFTILEAEDEPTFEDVAKRKLEFNTHYTEFLSDNSLRVTNGREATVKQTLYEAGYPVQDQRELNEGAGLQLELVDGLSLRPYQQEWVNRFLERGCGTFVGPSGSGKTIASIGVMEEMSGEALIIVPKRELAQQWEDELVEKTTLSSSQIGQYHGGEKTIAPITIATYDTARKSRHRKLFNERDWSLLILDECHHCCAPVWKRVANIQSKARLGLTATPVRETGSSKEIYSLIGPPVGTDWHALFEDGYVQKPTVQIRHVPWSNQREREKYQRATGHAKRQIAAMNPAKAESVESLLKQHANKTCVVFVEWLDQGREYAESLGVPFICGETPHKQREKYFEELRTGTRSTLIISRVGDEGIDIPNADICIIASTLGSSSAQTAQRIGRTMRPVGASKGYLLATKGSNEEDFVRSSTQYLAQQGIQVQLKD